MNQKRTIGFNEVLKTNRIPGTFNVITKPGGSLCNLNCSYCYYLEKRSLYPEINNFRMKDDILETYIRKYILEQETDQIFFVWQGGEPALIGLDFYKKALFFQNQYAAGKTIYNSFQTNGTLLNDDWCDFFAKHNFLIGISIDGPEEFHDKYRTYHSGKPSFKDVMIGVKLLSKHRVEFNTLTTVNDYNSHYPLEIYEFLKSIGSVFIQFLPVVERISHSEENLKLVPPGFQGNTSIAQWTVNPLDYGNFLISIFNRWVREDVGRYFIQIFDATLANEVGVSPGICVMERTCGYIAALEYNGDLYSCDHFVYEKNLLGNICKLSFKEMFASWEQFAFGKDKMDGLPEQCLSCNVSFICNGGCPKHRFAKTEKGEENINYLCEGFKKFFEHTGPYMKYMANKLANRQPPADIIKYLSEGNSF
jgi:uncharacterized protein